MCFLTEFHTLVLYQIPKKKNMPTKIHRQLERRARKLKLKGKRKKAYVFGTLGRIKKARKAKRKRK